MLQRTLCGGSMPCTALMLGASEKEQAQGVLELGPVRITINLQLF